MWNEDVLLGLPFELREAVLSRLGRLAFCVSIVFMRSTVMSRKVSLVRDEVHEICEAPFACDRPLEKGTLQFSSKDFHGLARSLGGLAGPSIWACDPMVFGRI